jgi:sporulation protein YlmC with PRC-barrel domain
MAHFGTLRDFRFSDADADEIRGAKVYGRNDEKLGKIDDVIFNHSDGSIHYAVVDTGGWLSSKKFLVPSNRLEASGKHEDDYSVDLSKQQVETFPTYDEKSMESEDDWNKYEAKYQDAWTNGPVQHHRDSDRNITPPASEIPTSTGSSYSGTRQPILEPEGSESERIFPPTVNEVEIPISGAGIGPRWSTFEERLRQRRKEITMQCTTCARSTASETASDRERDARKKAS